jgi:hypothetical protein
LEEFPDFYTNRRKAAAARCEKLSKSLEFNVFSTSEDFGISFARKSDASKIARGYVRAT